jgi:hypothetical protein
MAEGGRSLLRLAAALLFSGLLLLLGAEAALWTASGFAPDRSGAWRRGSSVRVLCVGDSHTFGAGVAEEESYPARLQRLLDEREPRRYSVINLGTPGMSTTQVLERLPLQLARYRPDLVILWAGMNNAWNLEGAGTGASQLEALALRSRLYRLARVALHDASLERAAAETRADGRHQEARAEVCSGDDCDFKARHILSHGGVVDVITNRHAAEKDPDGHKLRTVDDIREIHRLLSGAGVGLLLIRYPTPVGPSRAANAAIEAAGRELGIPVADSSVALARLPAESVEWLHAMHPAGPLYHEVAVEVLPLVTALADGGPAPRSAGPGALRRDGGEAAAGAPGHRPASRDLR